ncbi:MAG: glucose-methanol-choline oxidoreductase [Gammaproteobacteria bacterium]|nr:glucose-methanol-choline oxidoreductase [Gammaproteobacteria bacterium]
MYWRGRGLGGSSAINGQIAIRGMPEDYDIWAEQGCDGWAFKEVLPYFNQLETDLLYGHEAYHGAEGPIPIYRASLNEMGPVDRAMMESALNLKYAWAEDHNAPGALGVSPYAINNRNGKRVSTNDAYIEPNRGRNNLHIRGEAQVNKVIFSGDRAIGVELASGEHLHADNIILSAGAVHSPTILMRSGIGPADHLKEHDIDVKLDLPVGRNFQDHPVATFVIQYKNEYIPPPEFRHTNCCIRYSSDMEGAGPGDMFIVAMNGLGDSIGRLTTKKDKNFGTVGVWVNECYSRGHLELQSTDPYQDPIIFENMLDDERDFNRLRDGVERLVNLVHQPAFTQISSAIIRAGDFKPISDCKGENLDDWMMAFAGDTQHGTCTCRMGAEDDPRTVVDSACKVLGVDGLRVIDASIMPNVPRANTHLTAVMIGEKMAAEL